MSTSVKKEKVKIPTYVPQKAMDLPMFFENKPYQGASGRLYPLPFSDCISDEKTDVAYQMYTLENEYVKTQVLPEIGGKILRAYDKLGEYDFIYYNEVIKPALIGLAGPWISGGIEFNWPQHHRPTTFMPLEAAVEESPDGSKTVWVGEVDPFHTMKGMLGVTVDQGRSYIKAKVRLYNRTEQSQVFMWWANMAVTASETYKTIFPPDVEWVNDHDRRAVLSWPIAKGVYKTARPFDYGDGTDLSLYSSVKVPSSFLVSQGQSDMDFVAGYDGERGQGFVTVANHHIAPGKKMWHWGKGDFGDMWCANLTDRNGPYIELMTGVYTDNQPDFTWLAPYETRTFEQYWYPIRDIGDVKNASVDAAVNLEQRGDNLFVGFNVTGTFENAKISVKHFDKTLFEDIQTLTPDSAYLKEISINGMNIKDMYVVLYDADSKILVSYKTYERGEKQPITPRSPVKRPAEIENIEELFINGLHLEQYKQHNYNPLDYYSEALRRDNGHIASNTAMARISLKNGCFDNCVRYASKGIERLTLRNMHPFDTEAMYLKGLALVNLNRNKEAYDVLYMSAWDYKYSSAAHYELATLDCKNGDFSDSLEKLDRSYGLNNGHFKALNLKAAILRRTGRRKEAAELLAKIKSSDPLDIWSSVEADLLEGSTGETAAVFGSKPQNFIDVACDYIKVGFYDDAIFALNYIVTPNPLADYYRAFCEQGKGNTVAALEFCRTAEARGTGYCFPARLEDIHVLNTAISLNPCGANAYYYLGCLFYDRLRYDEAIALWEKAVSFDSVHAKAYRNLALGYFDKKQDFLSAKACLEKAMKCKPDDGRLLLEYQQLLKNINTPPHERLSIYEKYNDLMLKRDDCYLDKIILLSLVGDYAEAIEMAKCRKFHIYEGGEGKLTKQHAWMYVLYANENVLNGNLAEAEKLYLQGIDIPKSYGEAKTFFNQESHIYYYLGKLYEKQGLAKQAEASYVEAAVYKAAVSELSLFRALALRKLERYTEGMAVLNEMMNQANEMIENHDRRSYYGVGSLSPMPFENNIKNQNLVEGYILKAYALAGIGRFSEAEMAITAAMNISPYDFRVIAFFKIQNFIEEE